MASTTQPTPSTRILDELTAAAVYKDVQPVLVITKADLAAADQLMACYAHSGIPVVQLQYDTGEGLDLLRGYIVGHLCAFCGNSGVGKSTLLNALDPSLQRQTGAISPNSAAAGIPPARSRYLKAAAAVSLIPLVSQALKRRSLPASRRKSCSMPFRNLHLILASAGLPAAHRSETGCAVRAALQAGEISPSRYESYLAMYEEASQRKEWER